MKIPKPNFIIIGAAKCGTTTLASILSDHVDCCMARPKEVCFFQDVMDFKPNLNYEKGWEWYQNAFQHYAGEPMIGEATPSYADRIRSPNTAERIFRFNPEIKIIYMVRNPVDRQLSAWRMQWNEGMQNIWPDRLETKWAMKGIEFWINEQRKTGQWDESRYDFQLEAYRRYFDDSKIYVSFLEDWRVSQSDEISRILNFLGLNETLTKEQMMKEKNKGKDRKVERGILSAIREIPIIHKALSLLPLTWRKRIRRALLKTVEYPEISDGAFQEFIQYVGEDARKMLVRYNKPINYWKLF